MIVSSARFLPLIAKIRGRAPLCPWRSAVQSLDPRTMRIYYPQPSIEIVERDGELMLVQFDGKKRFWFPQGTPTDHSLWSEYLNCFWISRINYHYYFSDTFRITPGSMVIDCGTCEGFFTHAALEAGAGKVVCIEPSAMMVSCLEKTFCREIEQGKVVIEHAAIGSHEGQANFSAFDGNAFGGRMDANGTTQVRLTTMASIAGRHGEPGFVKMDLEGAEYEALLGGMEVLRRNRPHVAVTTYHYPWDHPSISALLVSAGYDNLSSKGVTMREGIVPRPVLIQASATAH